MAQTIHLFVIYYLWSYWRGCWFNFNIHCSDKNIYIFLAISVWIYFRVYFSYLLLYFPALLCVFYFCFQFTEVIFFTTRLHLLWIDIFFTLFLYSLYHYHDNSLSISPLPPVEYSDIGVTKLFETELVSEFWLVLRASSLIHTHTHTLLIKQICSNYHW